jgi:antagonist of KipI
MKASVTRAGYLTTVQDLGRHRHRQSGVPVGGALDTHALRVANLLVGNEPAAAGLEVTLGELRIQFADTRLVAWGGADFEVAAATQTLRAGHVASLESGEELLVRPSSEGGRAWIAIAGGIDVPLVLGSRSTELRSVFGGLNGRALRDGDTLPLRPLTRGGARVAKQLASGRISNWSASAEWTQTRETWTTLRVVRGAESGRFLDVQFEALVNDSFTVGTDSDRMGVRLRGPELPRTAGGELLSEPVNPGTIQVPPNGEPVLLLGDCQTIGGYPKIAHVITVDLAAAAQLWPGDVVRFKEVRQADARRLLIERERDLAWFAAGLALKTA